MRWLQNTLIWLAFIGQLGACSSVHAADLPEEGALLQGEVSLSEEFGDVAIDAPLIQFFDSSLDGMVIERPGMHRLLIKHTDEASGYVLGKADKVARIKNGLIW